jgi:hypothetical protein
LRYLVRLELDDIRPANLLAKLFPVRTILKDKLLEDLMNHIRRLTTSVAMIVLLTSPAMAQAPQGGAPGAPGGAPAAGAPGGGRGQQAPLASPNPIYMSVKLEVDVNKPAAEVWARVGKYCDIGEWLGIGGGCQIISGKDGELGAVRSVANEILVAKTDLSYTYTQPVRVGQFYPLYHGTVEAKPVTATTSKLIYSLMWDASNLADDAAREANKTQRATTFQTALNNMKILAEGGTLPARGGGGGGGGGRGPGGGAPGAGAPGGGQRRGQ